jgi:DNA-binding transcriptional regulator YdaS (Cro superfamily)
MEPPIHPLRRWLFERQQTAMAFAAQHGVSQSYLSECLSYRKLPSMPFAAAVTKATRGEVTANDLLAAYEAAQRIEARKKRRAA